MIAKIAAVLALLWGIFSDNPGSSSFTSFVLYALGRIGIVAALHAAFGVAFGYAFPRLAWRWGIWLYVPSLFLLNSFLLIIVSNIVVVGVDFEDAKEWWQPSCCLVSLQDHWSLHAWGPMLEYGYENFRKCDPQGAYPGRPVSSRSVSVVPCRSTQDERVAVEAYPAVVARRFLGRTSYKNDERRKQSPAQRSAREKLVRDLESGALKKEYGFVVTLDEGWREKVHPGARRGRPGLPVVRGTGRLGLHAAGVGLRGSSGV